MTGLNLTTVHPAVLVQAGSCGLVDNVDEPHEADGEAWSSVPPASVASSGASGVNGG